MIWPFSFFKRKKWEKLGCSRTATGLRSDLREKLKPEEVWLKDTDYRAIPLKDFQALMWNCRPQPLEKYRPEIFDCDDAAVCFEADMRREWAKRSKGREALAFGYISAYNPDEEHHAFIFQIDDNGSVNFIEPQTNSGIDWIPERITCMEG